MADSSTFAFWSKSSVDFEPRRIRLQSNSYTTNTLLDTVTAATIQVSLFSLDFFKNRVNTVSSFSSDINMNSEIE